MRFAIVAMLAPSLAQRVWNWGVSLLFLAIIVAGIWAIIELLVLPHHRESPARRSQPSGGRSKPRKGSDKAA